MLVGILETGRPAEKLQHHGSYPEMFERLLGPASGELRFKTYAAIDGDVPADPHACDAWLVTGSRHGAYERLPWMLKLEQLLRDAVTEKVPVVGICFGHQIMAQALGGKVVQSPKGWGFGLQSYNIAETPGAAGKVPAKVTLAALHQDQVVEVPTGGRVVGSSEFCPNAVIAYGDSALTFQPHPEFDVPFLRGVAVHRLKGVAPDDVLAAAERSFHGPDPDQPVIARWIADFLLANKAVRRDYAR
jgi:GMP synthase-like glutamine amidotransferase